MATGTPDWDGDKVETRATGLPACGKAVSSATREPRLHRPQVDRKKSGHMRSLSWRIPLLRGTGEFADLSASDPPSRQPQGLLGQSAIDLTVRDDLIRELEALLLRIARPEGNAVTGVVQKVRSTSKSVSGKRSLASSARKDRYSSAASPLQAHQS